MTFLFFLEPLILGFAVITPHIDPWDTLMSTFTRKQMLSLETLIFEVAKGKVHQVVQWGSFSDISLTPRGIHK
jgi:hypothetical protein